MQLLGVFLVVGKTFLVFFCPPGQNIFSKSSLQVIYLKNVLTRLITVKPADGREGKRAKESEFLRISGGDHTDAEPLQLTQ